MNVESIVAIAGCSLGMMLLVRSLVITTEIIEFASLGAYRRLWQLLRALMALFVVGYAAAAVVVLLGHLSWFSYLVGVIFLLGAVFVLLIVHGAYQSFAAVVAPTSPGAGPRISMLESASVLPTLLDQLVEREVLPAPSSPKIIVIDDDPLSRLLLQKLCERMGYESTVFASAAPALAALEGGLEVDAILLDLLLPEISGLRVLDRLHRSETLRDIPVLIVSAVEDKKRVVQCIERGAADFLQKPIDPVLVKARLDASLARRRMAEVERRAAMELERERRRADELLRAILPNEVVEELAETGEVAPRRAEHTAVVFADLVGFTRFSDRHEPEEVQETLQSIVALWEMFAAKHGVQKIKTIGDAFMGACGLWPRDERVVARCVAFGLEIIEALKGTSCELECRVGVHVGPVAAGIIGQRQFLYDIWGDTVNTAQRVESNGAPGSVCVSAAAQRELEEYNSRSLGFVELKGKGAIELFCIRPEEQELRRGRLARSARSMSRGAITAGPPRGSSGTWSSSRSSELVEVTA